MSLDRIVKSRLSPYWVDWIERNKLLWTSPDSSTTSPVKQNNATTESPGRNMNPIDTPDTGDKTWVPKSATEVTAGQCARANCDWNANRCSRYFCVTCCHRFHCHEDENNEAKGPIGFKVYNRSKHRETQEPNPLALVRTGTVTHLPLVDKPSLPVKLNVPEPGEVTKSNEREWIVGDSSSYLSMAEKDVLETQEFKDLMQRG